MHPEKKYIKVYIDYYLSTLLCANFQCIGAFYCTISPPCLNPLTELPVGRSDISAIFQFLFRTFTSI